MKIQMMVCSLIVGAVCCAGVAAAPSPSQSARAVAPDVAGASAPEVVSQWKGKKVAFLGDSITDKIHVGTSANYWNFLPTILGCDAYVYGKNGWQMSGMIDQARKLKDELGGDVDAIFIFAGTNDFNGGVPLGEWYAEEEAETRKNAQTLKLKHRRMLFDKDTFRGRINTLMAYLKKEFPDQQVILLTPIHRAYARFGEGNVQPDESWANTRGLFIDSYVNAVREAAGVWSVPVIDLYSECGLYPCEPVHAKYFHNAATDMLHPNAAGHERMARTMAYRMLALPSSFKK